MKENVKIAARDIAGLNDITLKGEVVVFGSTYMSKFPLYELINKSRLECAVYNRSIEGLTIKEATEIVQDCIIAVHPSKVFIALGEEDEKDEDAIKHYNEVVQKIRAELPKCQIFLIGLSGDSEYAKGFNDNMLSLCDGKSVRYIRLVSPALSKMGIYKARFKQMSCFFRNRPLNDLEIFAMADL